MRRLLDVLERWETELFLLGVAGWVLPMLDDRLAVVAPLRWALVASLLPWLYRIARWSRQAGVGWTVRFVASQLIGLLSPFVWLFTVRQLIGEGAARLRYRSGMPGPHDWRPRGRYRLPVEGVWTVVNGGPDPETSHSWSLWGQRYTSDLVVTDAHGRSAPEGARRPEQDDAWGRPTVAAADGTVVAVRDGHHDSRWIGIIDPLTRDPLGNFVVIEHAPGEYSLSAHLQCGSVAVRPGQRVQAGDVIGRCGHSGHSTEPHLHWQLMDRADFWRAASLPVRFAQYWRERDGRWELVSEAMPVRGERVSDRAPDRAQNGRARETPGGGAAVDHESGDGGRSALGGSAGRQ